jgi:imidazoleglycerol phosphate synthase glutamine amidotransferase subunit HisH
MTNKDRNGLGLPGVGADEGEINELHAQRQETMTKIQFQCLRPAVGFRLGELLCQRLASSSGPDPTSSGTPVFTGTTLTPGFFAYSRRLLVPHLTQDSLLHVKPVGSLLDLNIEAWYVPP